MGTGNKKKYDGAFILGLPMNENDSGARNVKDYLKELLSTLIKEEESFSGKRPFGNSGWMCVFEEPLVDFRIIGGDPDEKGDIEFDNKERDDALLAAIEAL